MISCACWRKSNWNSSNFISCYQNPNTSDLIINSQVAWVYWRLKCKDLHPSLEIHGWRLNINRAVLISGCVLKPLSWLIRVWLLLVAWLSMKLRWVFTCITNGTSLNKWIKLVVGQQEPLLLQLLFSWPPWYWDCWLVAAICHVNSSNTFHIIGGQLTGGQVLFI